MDGEKFLQGPKLLKLTNENISLRVDKIKAYLSKHKLYGN